MLEFVANLIETPKKETVPVADPSLINQWLQHHGYSLHTAPASGRQAPPCGLIVAIPGRGRGLSVPFLALVYGQIEMDKMVI